MDEFIGCLSAIGFIALFVLACFIFTFCIIGVGVYFGAHFGLWSTYFSVLIVACFVCIMIGESLDD